MVSAPSRRRGLLLLASAAVVVAAVLAVALGSTAEPEGGAEPVEASFTYFDGSDGALSDFRGRPLVLNF